jgi:hypothetical protein
MQSKRYPKKTLRIVSNRGETMNEGCIMESKQAKEGRRGVKGNEDVRPELEDGVQEIA